MTGHKRRWPVPPVPRMHKAEPYATSYNLLMLTPTEKIWHNGRFIPWQSATIHVLSHVVSYGSSVFEGIRCYSPPSGPAGFRLREHVRSGRGGITANAFEYAA